MKRTTESYDRFFYVFPSIQGPLKDLHAGPRMKRKITKNLSNSLSLGAYCRSYFYGRLQVTGIKIRFFGHWFRLLKEVFLGPHQKRKRSGPKLFFLRRK
jgi:hypothetical protein